MCQSGTQNFQSACPYRLPRTTSELRRPEKQTEENQLGEDRDLIHIPNFKKS
jgi:hypothetical protein